LAPVSTRDRYEMPLLEYVEVLGSIVSSREMSWARIGSFLYEEEARISFLLERLDTHHYTVNLNIRSASLPTRVPTSL
jgi:hypothetical protein